MAAARCGMPSWKKPVTPCSTSWAKRRRPTDSRPPSVGVAVVSAIPGRSTPLPITILFEAMAEELINRPCGGRYGDIVQAIGNTPLVELKRLSPKPAGAIWAQREAAERTARAGEAG